MCRTKDLGPRGAGLYSIGNLPEENSVTDQTCAIDVPAYALRVVDAVRIIVPVSYTHLTLPTT